MEYAQSQFADSTLAAQVGQSVAMQGRVVREPDERESFTQLYVQDSVTGERVLVRGSRFVTVAYGDTVQVSGTLTRPEPFLTDTGRTFDYPHYLKARGVQHVVSFAQVTVVQAGGGNPAVRWLLVAKGRFVQAVEAQLPPPASDLGLGLLLGVQRGLGDELEAAFRHTGLIHIVVLSGYNVMLVIAFFWWLSSWVLPLRGRVVFGVVGIVLFAVMVGLSATVVRASIMAALLLLAKYIGARYDVLRALLFAGFIMVLLNPYLLLYDLGFQLSFMATLGLVLFLPQFESTLVTAADRVGLRDILAATVVTQVFVLPLLLFQVGEVSLVSVVVNLLVLPVVAVAMALTFATGLLAVCAPALAVPVAALAQAVLVYILAVVQWFDQLPWVAVTVPPVSLPVVGGLYIGLAWVWWYLQRTAGLPGQLAGWQIEPETAITNKPDTARVSGSDVPVVFR